MNRTIKFRGWDIQRNEWVYGYFHMFGEWAIIIEYGKPGIPEQHIEVTPESTAQFTGLLDKNGKEIYEGDIVSIDGFNSQAVVFEKGQFLPRPHGEDFEVIGNIYENSDLLV